MTRKLIAPAALAVGLATGVAAAAPSFPGTIPLPRAFQPEGIAIGRGATFYVGSIPTGAIYRGNLRTGRGAVLVPEHPGRAAIGVAIDNRNRLFVAGGPTGSGFVYNARTGADVAAYTFTGGPTFVNDVVATRTGAYFTDSMRPFLYRVPIGGGGGLGSAQSIPLTGAIQYQAGFNANGIDATASGRWLVIVQTNTGKLFRVDPRTGSTTEIGLGGESVPNGDGILLDGRTFYVVQNQLNRVAVFRVNAALTSGRLVTRIMDARLAVPTTIDDFGRRLYAVNARFGAPPATTDYEVVQLRKVSGRR